MKGQITVIKNKYEVTVKPANWARRLLMDSWPYWQGSKAKFSVSIKTKVDIKHEHFNIFIEYPNGSPKEKELGMTDVTNAHSGDVKTIVLESEPFIYTGDTFITINAGTNRSDKPIYNFHVTNRSWVSLAIIVGAIAGILTIIGQIIINLINHD